MPKKVGTNQWVDIVNRLQLFVVLCLTADQDETDDDSVDKASAWGWCEVKLRGGVLI